MISDEDEEVKVGWSYCTAPTVVAMVKLFRLWIGLCTERQHQNLDGKRNAALRRKELTRRDPTRSDQEIR